MKNTQGILIIAFLILSSCNPKISTSLMKSYPPIDYKQEIVVIGLYNAEPDSSETLGQVKIGDTGFSTNCGYDIVINKAKQEVRQAGGNALKITKHTPPSALGSSCHRITAKILKINNIESYNLGEDEEQETLDVDYAILNVYRYRGAGALIGYDLNLGDSVVCRVKNNFKTTLHIKKDGLNTLWARTEAKSEVPINIKYGKTYYLRCGISMGAFVGRPDIELIDWKTGRTEFESFKAKNK
jgi:hypothetical protein